MKKTTGILLLSLCLLLCACGAQETAAPESTAPAAQLADDDAPDIVLTGEGAELHCGGVRADGGTITVAAAGEYRICGELHEGQIVVDTGEDAVDVTLILAGVSVSNPDGPALWVKQAKNVHLFLAAGSENLLCSGTEADLASFDDTRSGAALYAEDDLILEGEGRLQILGWLNNGLTCKDDLKIEGGVIELQSANNGVRASESVTLSGGDVSIRSGNDGLKTSSTKKDGKGTIEISGGSLTVSSGGDAVSAVTELRISGGSIKTETRQDLVSASSRKGLKAAQLVDLSGGSLDIRADEDGIHCDGDVRMSGGEAQICAVTGIQAGTKDSGQGDILLSGGKLFIAAEKQALKAEGSLFANNELLALCGSDKQAEPAPGGQAWLMAAIDGETGDEVHVGPGTENWTAPMRFRVLLCSSAEFVQGERCEVSVGERSYTLSAR